MPAPIEATRDDGPKPSKAPKPGSGVTSSPLPTWEHSLTSGTPSTTPTAAPGITKPAGPDPALLANLLESLAATAATADAAPFDMGAVDAAKEEVEKAATARSQEATTQPYIQSVGAGTVTGAPLYPPKPETDAPNAENKLAEATTQLTDALRSQRIEALGAEIQGPRRPGEARKEFRESAEKVDPLTQEEYDAMLPKQRAAVDFNTMLVSAVRRDIRLQDEYDPNKEQTSTYEKSVEKVLGEGNGSDLYAPETMALLRQIDFHDTAADLDDFLSLDTAITARDIKNLKTEPGPTVREATLNPVEQDRYQLTENLATSTQLIEEELSRGEVIIQDIQTLLAQDKLTDVTQYLGGLARKDRPAGVGYDTASQYAMTDASGNPTLNANFIEAFDTLAARGSDSDEVLGYLKGLYSPKDFNAFMGYVDNRSKQAERYGLPLSENPDFKFPDPAEFRVQLGLEKEADDGGR
jgi:hypothetical protein